MADSIYSVLKSREAGPNPYQGISLVGNGSLTYSVSSNPKLDSKRMTLTYRIATPALDREREIVLPSGVNCEHHKKNPIVLFDHQHHLPVGLAQDPSGNYTTVVAGDCLESTVWLSQESKLSEEVYYLAENGLLNGASIGFTVHPGGERIATDETGNKIVVVERCDMHEWSTVWIPMNPDALKLGCEIVQKGFGRKRLSADLLRLYSPHMVKGPAWSNGFSVEKKHEFHEEDVNRDHGKFSSKPGSDGEGDDKKNPKDSKKPNASKPKKESQEKKPAPKKAAPAKKSDLSGPASATVKTKTQPQKPKNEAIAKAVVEKQKIGLAEQRYAENINEALLAESVGGRALKDNEPVDVVVLSEDGKPHHGCELKTMLTGSFERNRIDMCAYARIRKVNWLKANPGTPLHTVVFDDRTVFDFSGEENHKIENRRMFYRRGIAGSPVIYGMQEFTTMDELKELMDTKEEDLPKKARRVDHELFIGNWTLKKEEDGTKYFHNDETDERVYDPEDLKKKKERLEAERKAGKKESKKSLNYLGKYCSRLFIFRKINN